MYVPASIRSCVQNVSEFKIYFITLIKDLSINTLYTTVNDPQANNPVGCLHQVINNIIITKGVDKKFFEYIDPWIETL